VRSFQRWFCLWLSAGLFIAAKERFFMGLASSPFLKHWHSACSCAQRATINEFSPKEVFTVPYTGSYDRPLRVIGQEVSGFSPECLEIALTADVFVVRVASLAKDLYSSGPPNSLMHWRELAEMNPETDGGHTSRRWFERLYTPEDIEKLDKEWAKRRGDVDTTPELWCFPNVWNFAELLRTVARYIDVEGGRLLKITTDTDTLRLYLQYKDGNITAQECSLMALCKIQSDMIVNRETLRIQQTAATDAAKDAMEGLWRRCGS
jgi:hypothetical protein